jgi:signal transduction histidine kinase
MRNEINNPLNAILGLGRELERGTVPPERAGRMGGMIAAEASGLDFQIRNIFCAADLESGEAEPAITPVDTVSVLRDVLDSLAYPCRDKGVVVHLEVSGDGARPFGTDAALFRAVAANLVSNAIKFSLDGGDVQVLLRLAEGELALEIKDAGVGFRPESKALLFERFRQLETGAARLHQGHGLGLAVVKAVTDLLGGTITATSEPGQGSVFTCRLPEGMPLSPGGASTLDGNMFFFGEAEEV